jgi:3-oxoadipate enol-lactonase
MNPSLELEDVEVPTCLGRIRVRVAGSGPGLMFWPSLMMDGELWMAQAQHFVGRYRVVLIDSPGHGRSEALTRMFGFDECARCVVQIMDALGLQQTHFVGNSWGGMIGGTFAALYPQRIGAAVLMNATASPAKPAQKIEYWVLTRTLRLLGQIRGPLTGLVVKAFIGPSTARDRPWVAGAIKAALKRSRVRSVYWAIRSVVPARPDQRPLFAKIRTPVLVVAGIEDQTFPVSETRLMADAIPGSEFVVLPETAHLAALERPDLVNPLIERFLLQYPLN